MKKGLLLGFVFVMFFGFSVAGDGGCANDDQIIMKLYNSSNAHGAVWSDANYGYDICYDDVFNVLSGGGSDVHDCDGANAVLSLWSESNAHAYAKGDFIDVCYKGLTCDRREGSCNTGESAVVRMSNARNAHLADVDFTDYNIVVCCRNDGTIVIGDSDLDRDGYTVEDGDCDESDEFIHPGADEICDNEIDDNCDGEVDEDGCTDSDDDADSDGYTVKDGDCDDSDDSVYPGALEICDNEIDDNCDGEVDEDGCTNKGDEDVYWEDESGNVIDNATVGETVRMVVVGVDMGLKSFDIYGIDGLDMLGNEVSEEIEIDIPGALESSGNYVGEWEITKEARDKAYSLGEDYEGFRFEIGDRKSNFLKINLEEKELRWEDKNGNEIINAKIGETVRMVIAGGGSGTFEVWDRDDGDELIVGEISGETDENGNFVGEWEISEENMDKAKNDLFGGDDDEDYKGFYFKFDGEESGDLEVKLAGDVRWENMEGTEIFSADVGDSVRMVRVGNADSGSFYVLDYDGALGTDLISEDIEGKVDDNGNFVGVWKITKEDIEKAKNSLVGVPLSENFENFYFEIEGKESGYLKVNHDVEEDDPIEIDLVSPKCGDYYDEGSIMTIEVYASDPDDELKGDIFVYYYDDDGKRREVDLGEFGNGGVEIEEEFPVPGNLEIRVRVANDRGKRSMVISNIMILEKDVDDNYADRDYVAACINRPKNYELIKSERVKFDASDTRGIRVIGGAPFLFKPGEDAFDWDWKFRGPSGELYNTSNVYGGIDKKGYEFFETFPVRGDNSAFLNVELGESRDDMDLIPEFSVS